MSETPRSIDVTALPANAIRYLDAHRSRDIPTAVDTFTDDAVVIDDGHTYSGLLEIQ